MPAVASSRQSPHHPHVVSSAALLLPGYAETQGGWPGIRQTRGRRQAAHGRHRCTLSVDALCGRAPRLCTFARLPHPSSGVHCRVHPTRIHALETASDTDCSPISATFAGHMKLGHVYVVKVAAVRRMTPAVRGFTSRASTSVRECFHLVLWFHSDT